MVIQIGLLQILLIINVIKHPLAYGYLMCEGSTTFLFLSVWVYYCERFVLCCFRTEFKVKVITLDIPQYRVTLLICCGLQRNFPARNTPENSPNLGVSILSSVPSPLGDEIGGHPHTNALSPSSHIELVPIIHLGEVRRGLQKHCPMFPPFTDFCWDRESNPDCLCSSPAR